MQQNYASTTAKSMKKSNDILIPEFERLLQNGHLVEFRPSGVSMRPFIEGGSDKVVLKACQQPEVGMIVLAKVGNIYVLHRIYHIQGEQITLRGDGNITGQESCSLTDIIGYVVEVKRKNRKSKRLTKAIIWRHLPINIKRLYLKIYRKTIKWKYTNHEN
jgi:hypothetical protein